MKLLSHVRLLATPWTAAYQAPLSMGFSSKSTGVVGCHCLLLPSDAGFPQNTKIMTITQVLALTVPFAYYTLPATFLSYHILRAGPSLTLSAGLILLI